MIEFWTQSELWGKSAISIAAAIIAALFMWGLRLSITWFKSRRTRVKILEDELRALREELRHLQQRLSGAEDAVDGDGLWLARPVVQHRDYPLLIQNSIPIITIANLKGGVGKTTLTAHLARFYADQGKRVLAIDLDYQGSLSSLSAHGNTPTSRVSQLVLGKRAPGTLKDTVYPMENAPPEAAILTSHYELARIENQVMVHWLTQREERDVRYFLADVLLTEYVQSAYDIILIDAAPRITTSTVQALCASTQVLIPTKLDGLSVDAVGYFMKQLLNMKKLWPYLGYAGVVGTMTDINVGKKTQEPYDSSALVEYEAQAILRAETRLTEAFDSANLNQPPNLVLPYPTFVPQKRDIARLASDGFGEPSSVSASNRAEISDIFERLGRELANRVGLAL